MGGVDDGLGEGELFIICEPCLVNVDAFNVDSVVAWELAEGVEEVLGGVEERTLGAVGGISYDEVGACFVEEIDEVRGIIGIWAYYAEPMSAGVSCTRNVG